MTIQTAHQSVSHSPHILVIRRRYLGDIVLLGSVFRNLKLHWPDARLTVLTEPAYSGVLPLNPDIDAALTFPRGALGWPGFVRALRAARFTHVLDFDNTDRTALAARLTGAGVRATFDRELIPFKYGWAYTHTAKVANRDYDRQHITETYLRLPAAIGVPIASRELRLMPQPENLAGIDRLLPDAPAGATRPLRVLVHPGSRSTHRIWPLERFAAVCDRLQDELGAQVFLTAGPAEQHLADGIRKRAKSHIVATPAPSDVGTLAALLSRFDVLLCHDSGPMHVAAAVGTRVVALFGSQNAAIWRPVGDRHTVLQTALPCSCLPDTPQPCVKSDSYRCYCVRKLAADEVFTALKRSLSIND